MGNRVGQKEGRKQRQLSSEAQGLLDITPTKLCKLQENDSSLREAQVLASWAEPGEGRLAVQELTLAEQW